MMRRVGTPLKSPFASEVVRRTREAWLPSGASRPCRLNGIRMREPKRVIEESGAGARQGASSGRARWLSIFVALIVVVSVLAGELWAARDAPAFDSTTVRQIVADVSTTLARVAATSVVISPVD